ncbi:MAG TPA: hypothetical protein PKJ97_04035, partial [Candidatus Bilamarchaeaceae archaeon]|nr:hypothetical protein [Candidatus Bilamarchaeaceae archaeon]
MKVCLETYGCTLNQADSDMMKGVLISAGHSIVGSARDADVVVLNTCTVKGKTENKIISRIEGLGRKGKRIVVAGCLSINRKRVRNACPGAVLVHPGAVAMAAEAVEDAASRELDALFTVWFGTPDPGNPATGTQGSGLAQDASVTADSEG